MFKQAVTQHLQSQSSAQRSPEHFTPLLSDVLSSNEQRDYEQSRKVKKSGTKQLITKLKYPRGVSQSELKKLTQVRAQLHSAQNQASQNMLIQNKDE